LTGKVAKETFTEVPKIDFQRIYSDKLEERKELAKEVGAACRDVGFFYAVNHGVDEAILNDTMDALKKYFALPTEVKMETHNQKTEKFRGYEAFLEGKLDPSTRGGMSHHPFTTFTSSNILLQISKKVSSWAKMPPTPNKTGPSHTPHPNHATNGPHTPLPSSGAPQSIATTPPCTLSAS
jgi:isopenicillin N synthase-like dioxygenase